MLSFPFGLRLAALHYNFNNQKAQAVTKKGEKRFSILVPKYKKGKHIVREVKEESSYG